jgi:ribosomal protein S18 acetylase RimI-like enzyme
MVWELTHDVDAYRAAAAGYLAADPVRNTVLLTVADMVERRGTHVYGADAPRFGWWRSARDGAVGGAFVHTPPQRPLLGPMPDPAVRELVRGWRDAGTVVAGVSGGAGTVRRAAEEWVATGGGWSVHQEQRLYQLGELSWPRPRPQGAARTADAADLPLLADWFADFTVAVGGSLAGINVRAQAENRVGAGRILLWEADGVPVSMAGLSPVVAGQGRVAPVYTPPGLRGRGYAGAVTCAASEALRAAGARWVLLFTDLANPTSNALYQRLGYRPLEDSLVVDFTD